MMATSSSTPANDDFHKLLAEIKALIQADGAKDKE